MKGQDGPDPDLFCDRKKARREERKQIVGMKDLRSFLLNQGLQAGLLPSPADGFQGIPLGAETGIACDSVIFDLQTGAAKRFGLVIDAGVLASPVDVLIMNEQDFQIQCAGRA